MIEWDKVGEGWAGFGVTILVLIILSVAAWITGAVVQKVKAKDEETAEKREE